MTRATFKRLSIAAMSAVSLSGAACAAPILDRMMGGPPAGEPRYACFQRVYDEAHLKRHPLQNVKTVMLLAVSDAKIPAAVSLEIGVTFRTVKGLLLTSAGCGATDVADQVGCDGGCEGGSMQVTLRADGAAMLSVPDGARLWRPGEKRTDPHGAFGPDDKLFRLERAPAAACAPVVSDDEERARLTRAK